MKPTWNYRGELFVQVTLRVMGHESVEENVAAVCAALPDQIARIITEAGPDPYCVPNAAHREVCLACRQIPAQSNT